MSLEPRVTPITYKVDALPADMPATRDMFAVYVEARGEQWAVKRNGSTLGTDGKWSYGAKDGEDREAWLAAHRFDLDTALDLAREAALRITVGPDGHKVNAQLAWERWAAGLNWANGAPL